MGTVAALLLIEEGPVAAALLDSPLADRDVTPVVRVLTAKSTPFVIHSSTGLRAESSSFIPMCRCRSNRFMRTRS